MSRITDSKTDSCAKSPSNEDLLCTLDSHFQAMNQVRRGVCLVNAGKYEQAASAFGHAQALGSTDASLPCYVAASFLGRDKPEEAAEELARAAVDDELSSAARIRLALSLWAAEQPQEAVDTLREGIRQDPESAELHFQLGTLMTRLERYDEAELRFAQVLSIDRDHTESLVSMGLCCGLRHATREALDYLQRAQRRRPHDARIGLLVSQAAQAAQRQGKPAYARLTMPEDDPAGDETGIAELARVIQMEPDFVDAFIAIPVGRVDERVFAMLLKTIQAALKREPRQSELHFQCSQVLQRLGRCEDAINENERAVQLDPGYTRALIELAKLYSNTDRAADATSRLEQAVEAGAEFADVFYLLGNLYRRQGYVSRARSAYRRAIAINNHFKPAIQALAGLHA